MSAEGARRFFNAESLRQKDKVEAFKNQEIGFLVLFCPNRKGRIFLLLSEFLKEER